MFKAIDFGVLRLCTALAHRLQQTVGVTSYAVAKIGIGMAAMALLVDLMNYFTPLLREKTSVFELIIAPIILIDMIWRSLACQKADDALWSGRHTKPAELIFYIDDRYGWRVFWLLLACFELVMDALPPYKGLNVLEFLDHDGFSGGLTLFWYFIAVTPLPPGQSKLRQWIQTLRTQQHRQASELVPVKELRIR